MTRLLLVRHAETGCGGRLQGWTDAPLNALGEAQVERLVSRLADESYEVVYCSDLQRARQTAAPLVGNRPFVLNASLREVNFGQWEDQSYEELAARFPEAVRRWETDPVNTGPPGGESLAQMAQRGIPLLVDFGKYETALIVGHQGPLRASLCHWLGMPLANYWRLHLDHAGLTVLDTYPEGAILSLLNDCHHLERLQ